MLCSDCRSNFVLKCGTDLMRILIANLTLNIMYSVEVVCVMLESSDLFLHVALESNTHIEKIVTAVNGEGAIRF